MRVGFFGGLVLLGLTIIFSTIAIQNNKIAREITIKNFGLNKYKKIDKDKNDTNKTTIKITIKKEDSFDREFKNFDKQFNNF